MKARASTFEAGVEGRTMNGKRTFINENLLSPYGSGGGCGWHMI